MMQRLRCLLARMEQGKAAPIVQFVKFGMVGAFNTLLNYGIEMLGYYLLFSFLDAATHERIRVFLATGLGFVVSVISSFLLNSRFVFKGEGERTRRQRLGAFIKTTLCYALTGLVLSPQIKLWLGGMDIPYWAAVLLSLLVTIPLNFALNKFWAYRNE